MPAVQKPHCSAWWRLKAACSSPSVPSSRRQAFHRVDPAAIALHGQGEAGARGDAVDAHGAGAAHAVLAADVGAGRAEFLAQEITEQQARLGHAAARCGH